ncbi:hypothetical protein ACTVPT_26285 [Serratia bockelmannii]|uniref:hypothetical protein n=1 Tax=Serratia TaxID=613 RepID=UPI00146BCD00|nr:hypothetical protein [Serratia marcescens]NMT27268.1 hypothetical protein [Serratia marcescens]
MTQQKHFFDVTEISQRVKVEKPYFAFQQLWSDEDSLVGTFSSEQPLVYEAGLITAGELGRHMAILGSCTAAALHNGPEGYYLATKAHFIRKQNNQTAAHGRFYASSRVLHLDKRSLKVSAQAWNSEPVAELICEYTILSPALFQRNFRHYANDSLSTPSNSPYKRPVPIYNLMLQHDRLDACAGPLSPLQCAGHFSGYPCWPVAIISQTAFQVTGELLKKIYGTGTRFCVWDTQLSAEKLIGAGSVLKFRIEIMAAPENANQLKSTVSVYKDDELVAYLENQLELVLAG